MKTKQIPSVIMLLAGAVASIAMFVKHYELKTFLTVLLSVLIVAYIIGHVIRKILDKYVAPAYDEPAEGEVIEKETAEETEEGSVKAEQVQTGREAEKTKE